MLHLLYNMLFLKGVLPLKVNNTMLEILNSIPTYMKKKNEVTVVKWWQSTLYGIWDDTASVNLEVNYRLATFDRGQYEDTPFKKRIWRYVQYRKKDDLKEIENMLFKPA